MDRLAGRAGAHGERFPRRRGDGPCERCLRLSVRRFPPQARGWTVFARWHRMQIAVSPAGAGMDPRPVRPQRRRVGFPRRRGDGPPRLPAYEPPVMFPPQARGWTFQAVAGDARPLVSPAGAGMDPLRGSGRRRWCGFPRRRGDGPRCSGPWYLCGEFPPQARGWTLAAVVGVAPGRVSPAGAGMAPPRPTSSAVNFSFPRRRGDGPR